MGRRSNGRSRLYQMDAWRRLRRDFLTQNPFCVRCFADGREVLAEEVDHIFPISKGGEEWSLDNLQGLCKSCHSKKTASEDRRQSVPGCDSDGIPRDPSHPWNR